MTASFSTQDYVSMAQQRRASVEEEEPGILGHRNFSSSHMAQFLSRQRRIIGLLIIVIVIVCVAFMIIKVSTGGGGSSNLLTSQTTDDGPTMFEGRTRLLHKLMATYDKRDHPIRVILNFGISLLRFDFDEVTKHFGATVWLRMVWTDPRFRWSPEEFGGMTTLHVPSEQVWIPDITLYNKPRPTSFECGRSNVLIFQDGSVLWVPECYAVPTCEFNLEHSQQNCSLKFGSWTFHTGVVDMQMKTGNVSLEDYHRNPDWKLTGTKLERTSKKYPCCPDDYVDLTMSLNFSRRSTTPLKDGHL